MPYKLKRPCSYLGCPRLATGRYCEEHQKIITAHYNKHGRDCKRRYGRAWQKICDRYLAEHPLCEKCREAGQLTNAEKVHHIKPFSKGVSHVESNLMALCKQCHSEITAREGVSVGRFSPFRVGLKTPISVNLKSPMHHVCY